MRLLFSIGFLNISWVDMIDVSLVTYLLYQLYKLMRGSVAIKVFLGFLSLYLSFLLVKAAEMELLTAILGQFMGVGVIALLILFQQEIRKFLLLIGKTTVFNNDQFFRSFPWRRALVEKQVSINPIVEAAKTMSASHTGALIVFARDSELKFYTDSGDELDAIISKRLLISIFNKYSPMHDGAVIIVRNRIKAARCILPVSENDELPASFGLRHRAAIGLTEITDAVVLVVSEETGQMSLVANGKVMHNLSAQELRSKLNQYMLDNKEELEEVKLSKEELRNARETA
ncbi:TIGR00159 family protein [Rhodocytophaga rosea]|uniref:Diadenylate cyclase n=1 Tax=Rhodocytophaga rosea TaxID=2704465 RepID=A0A6C0GD14_9BACT|nr:diadenylate cyclase CdaA [Rhodocytophaga rosea]QHT65855.1 TIGR00159 family protein [Rhodocytophaga rosea]